jgi:formylglycine-generating enzyme required for sulfatase activity
MLATGHKVPAGWAGWMNKTPPRGEEDQLVVDVSWYGARDYCQWLSEVTGRGYGLSSKAEWKKEVRGNESGPASLLRAAAIHQGYLAIVECPPARWWLNDRGHRECVRPPGDLAAASHAVRCRS